MPSHNTELLSLLISVIKGHRVVKRQVVACEAAPHDSGMGGEHRSHGNLGVLQIKKAGPGLPLVELSHYLVGRAKVEPIETLYDMTGGIAEQDILLVIPVTCD